LFQLKQNAKAAMKLF